MSGLTAVGALVIQRTIERLNSKGAKTMREKMTQALKSSGLQVRVAGRRETALTAGTVHTTWNSFDSFLAAQESKRTAITYCPLEETVQMITKTFSGYHAAVSKTTKHASCKNGHSWTLGKR